MSRRTTNLLGALLLGLLAASGAFVLGMRARSAGSPGAYASVIRHTGRTTGQPYETPVGVDRPQVVPIEAAADHLSANDPRFHRLFGVHECLRMRRVEPQGAEERPTAPW